MLGDRQFSQQLCCALVELNRSAEPQQKQYFIQQDIMSVTFLLLMAGLLLQTHAKLYSVVALISSGATYHTNDLYDGSSTKQKWGQITPVGLRQHQNLGKALRKDYVELNAFLGKNFNKSQFQIQSKSFDRTIQSGLVNLYGMYGVGNGQKLEAAQPQYHLPPYSNKSDIQQPVFALPQGQLIKIVDYSSNLIESCPNEQTEVERNIRVQLQDYNEMVLTYTPFIKRMANLYKVDPLSMNFTKLASLYNTIRVDRYLGRALPPEFTQADLANIQHLYDWYNHFVYTSNLAKAINTFKFTSVLNRFDQKIGNLSTGTKWLTISADEVDIVAAQTSLNISSALCIEELYRRGETAALNCEASSTFASSLIFQLHSDNAKDFYVKVRNNGKYVNLCNAKQSSCDYSVWKEKVKAETVKDPSQICGKTQSGQPTIVADE